MSEKFDPERWKNVYMRACYNMRCTELPDPEIVYDENDPSPFSINHCGWKPHLNVAAIPGSLPETGKFSKEDYFEDASEHDMGHYKIAPFDLRTYISFVDAVSKKLSRRVPERTIGEYAQTIINMFTDLVVDSWRHEGYGRQPVPGRVEWALRETMKEINQKLEKGKILGGRSSTMRIFHKTYEEFWKVNIGVEEIEKISEEEKQTAKKLADVLGDDYKNREKWYEKISRFAEIIAPHVIQDFEKYKKEISDEYGYEFGGNPEGCGCKERKPQMPLVPMDIQATLGVPKPLDDKDEGVVATVAEVAFGLNEENYENYKITVVAAGIETGEARRFWYRIRAKNLIDIKETEKGRGRPRRSYYEKWEIGDPVEKLDIYKSATLSPVLIPGITTFKPVNRIVPQGAKKHKMVPDLLIIRDSSESMDGEKYEAAKIGGFAALDVASKYGVRVAFVDHCSGVSIGDDGKELEVGWTTNYRNIEDAMLGKEKADGGTVLPTDLLMRRLKENKNNPVRTIWLSDAELNGCEADVITQEVERFIEAASSGLNGFTLLHITPESYQNAPIKKILDRGGEVKQITNPEDIAGTIIGTVCGIYEEKG